MTDEMISKVFNIAGPLLGAAVGGLISFLGTRGLDNQRWRRERQDRLAALRREGFAAALEWIEPMRSAEIRASALVMAAIRGEVEREILFKDFPYLLGDLKKLELTASQRAVLSDDVNARGHRIIQEFDELRILGVRYGEEARVKGLPMAGFQECSAKLDSIRREISQLETDLRKAFSGTFE